MVMPVSEAKLSEIGLADRRQWDEPMLTFFLNSQHPIRSTLRRNAKDLRNLAERKTPGLLLAELSWAFW